MLSWAESKQPLIESLASIDSSESVRYAYDTRRIEVEDKDEAGPCRHAFRSATVRVIRSG
jgi:hypothetical protein